MTCFRWGQLERGPGGGDGAAHTQVLRRGEEWPRPGGRAGQEGATVQTSGKTRSSCYSSLDHVGYIWMIQNLSNMRMFSVKLPSIDSIEFPSSLVPTGQLRPRVIWTQSAAAKSCNQMLSYLLFHLCWTKLSKTRKLQLCYDCSLKYFTGIENRLRPCPELCFAVVPEYEQYLMRGDIEVPCLQILTQDHV